MLSAFVALFFLSGCNLDTRMSTFKPKGPIAETQLDLFMLTVWVTGFIFLVVGGVYDMPSSSSANGPMTTDPCPHRATETR